MLRSILMFLSILFLSGCATTQEESDKKREAFVLKTNYKLESLPQGDIFLKQFLKKFSYTDASNRLYTGAISITTPGNTETKVYDEDKVQTGGILADFFKKALIQQGVNPERIKIIPSNQNPDLKNALLVSIIIDHQATSYEGPAFLETTYIFESLGQDKLVESHKFRSSIFGGCWACVSDDINDKKAISKLLINLNTFLSNENKK